MMENSESGKLEKSDVRRISTEFFNISHHELMTKMKGQEDDFHEFCQARVSYDTLRVVAFLFFIVSLYFYSLSLVHAKSRVLIIISACSLFFVRNPLFMFVIYLKSRMRSNSKSRFIMICAKWLPFLSSFVSVHSTFGLGLYLIARVLNGPCDHLDQLHVWGCNPEPHALPQDVLLCLMFTPVLYATIFKAIQFKYVMVSWTIVVLTACIAIGLGNAYLSIPILLIYSPLSLVFLYESYRQNVILFLISVKQQNLLHENKKLAEDSQNELRFMIANMAHDLKTPLSAFINGVEILSSLASDLKKPNLTSEKTKSLHASIGDNIKNLLNVNNFMTMTVNRCIDYMKASKGIKLEPRLETINLQEVLSMPLNCMRDLQSRIAIIQKPISTSVCSHIITDVQWFQENLFCLISNAVKYSSHGHVTITVEKATLVHHLLAAAKEKKDGHARAAAARMSESEDSLQPEVTSHPESYAFLDNLLSLSRDDRETTVTIDETLNRMELGAYKKPDPGSAAATKHASRRFKKGNAVYAEPPSEPTESQKMMEMMQPMARHGEEETTEVFLLIEVEDTGIGLSDEVKETLFKPFKQAQRRAGGTGLGLYSLAKRVDALGGYYGVSNRRDGEQGSIFWFAVPYRPDTGAISNISSISKSVSLRMIAEEHPNDPADVATHAVERKTLPDRGVVPTAATSTPTTSPSSSLLAASLTPHGGSTGFEEKLRILLVDDSLTILKMTSSLLKRHGHVVDQEENGADAIAALERNRAAGTIYDVVLMDLNMPVMDGLEAMKRLRETESNFNHAQGGDGLCHQRVFAFSANSDRETMAEALEAGADDFICKPFSIQTFNEKYLKLKINAEVLGNDARTIE